jgi:orotate phosphoribosyltransferase
MSPIDPSLRQRIAVGLYDYGLLKTWYRDRPEGWWLDSGLWSPIYLQLGELASMPGLLTDIGEAIAVVLEEEVPDAAALVGIAYGGIPIAVTASLASGVPATMTRKVDAKSGAQLGDYSRYPGIESCIPSGGRVVLLDDSVASFDSMLVSAHQVEFEASRLGLNGVRCRDAVVVVDTGQGGAQVAEENGFALHAILHLGSDVLEALRPRLATIEYDVLEAYLGDSSPFQEIGEQQRLAASANASS